MTIPRFVDDSKFPVEVIDEGEDPATTRRTRILFRHGDHDQSSHGRGGGGSKTGGKGKGGKGSSKALHDEKAIRATYNYHDEKTGLTAEVTAVNGGKGPGSPKYVEITITDRDGNWVGEATRTVQPAGTRTVTHETLTLVEDVQGQGFATRFNAQAEASYRASGVERVELTANIDVGGYSWARAGYDFKDDDSRSAVAELAREQLSSSGISDSARAEFESVLGNPDSSPIDFAMVGHTPGATTWPGKEMMLDSTWDGVKVL